MRFPMGRLNRGTDGSQAPLVAKGMRPKRAQRQAAPDPPIDARRSAARKAARCRVVQLASRVRDGL